MWMDNAGGWVDSASGRTESSNIEGNENAHVFSRISDI